jgi:alpha-1,3/alpha-1,6-mannosyltransferase
MYMNCTVIACNSGGPLESIVDKKTGYLLPPDPEVWADQITNILNDPSLNTGE